MYRPQNPLCLGLAISWASLLCCDEQKDAVPAETPNSVGSVGQPDSPKKPDAAVTPLEAKKETHGAGPSKPGAEASKSGAACLAGRWHYDFADDAVETMIANLPGGKVTKEEGELICESTLTGNQGAWTCSSAGGKPVVIEVAANQAGMPLLINVKMSGKTSSQYKLVDEKTMQITTAAIGDLKMEVQATIAGNKIPFPATPLLQALSGEMGATNSYECSGDELRLRTQTVGETSWQKLRRLK